jgi:hypothetical protein
MARAAADFERVQVRKQRMRNERENGDERRSLQPIAKRVAHGARD